MATTTPSPPQPPKPPKDNTPNMPSEETLSKLPPSVSDVIKAGGQTGGVTGGSGGGGGSGGTTTIQEYIASQTKAGATDVTGLEGTPYDVKVQSLKRTAQEQFKARKLEEAKIFGEEVKKSLFEKQSIAGKPTPVQTTVSPEVSLEVRQRLEKKAIQQTAVPESVSSEAKKSYEEVIIKPRVNELEKEVGAGIRKKLQEKEIQQTKTGTFYEPTRAVPPITFIEKVKEEIPEIELIGKGIKEVPKYFYGVGADIKSDGLFPSKRIAEIRRQEGLTFISKPEVQAVGAIAALMAAPPIIQLGVGGIFYTSEIERFIKNPSIIRPAAIATISLLPYAIKAVKKSVVPQIKASVERVFFSKPDSNIIPIKGTQFVKSRLAPYSPQYETRPILTEIGKQVGIDIVLKPGQQKFPNIFDAPAVKTGKTEFGLPIELGRPPRNIVPIEKQFALKEILPNKVLEIIRIKDVKGRLTPEGYGKFLESKGVLNFVPESSNIAFKSNSRLLGFYKLEGKGTIPTVEVVTGLGKVKPKVLAHELIHFEQSMNQPKIFYAEPILPKKITTTLLGKKWGSYVSYRSQPAEIGAFGLQKSYAKKGFEVNLGKEVYFKVSQPFTKEKLPPIPKLTTTASRQIELKNFGFKNPLSKEILKKPIIKKVSKSIIDIPEPEAITTQKTGKTILILKTKVEPKTHTKTLKMETIKPRVETETTTIFPKTPFIDVTYERQETSLYNIEREKGLTTQGVIIIPKQIITPTLTAGLRPTTMLSQKSILEVDLGTKQKQELNIKSDQIISVIQEQTPKQDQKQEQDIGLDLAQKQTQIQDIKQDLDFFKPRKPIPEIPEIIIPKGRKEEVISKKSKSMIGKTEAFIPELKRFGKFMPVGKATTLESALDIATKAAKTTLGATFRVRKVKAIPKTIKTSGEFGKYRKEFRQFSLKKGKKTPLPQFTFIQKRSSRLGTKAEVKEIFRAKRIKGGFL